MSEDTYNLFPPDGPKWAAITCHKRQSKLEGEKRAKEISHHELLYGGRVICKMTG